MSDFIRVIGDSPLYNGKLDDSTTVKFGMWISRNVVTKVHPLYGIRGDDGHFFKCTPDTKGAEVYKYVLIDHHENQYWCNEEDLKGLGINPTDKEKMIGFDV